MRGGVDVVRALKTVGIVGFVVLLAATLFSTPVLLDPYPLPFWHKAQTRFLDFFRFDWVAEYQPLLAGIAALVGLASVYLQARSDTKRREAQERADMLAALLIIAVAFDDLSNALSPKYFNPKNEPDLAAFAHLMPIARLNPAFAKMINLYWKESVRTWYKIEDAVRPHEWGVAAAKNPDIRRAIAVSSAMSEYLSAAAELKFRPDELGIRAIVSAALGEKFKALGLRPGELLGLETIIRLQ